MSTQKNSPGSRAYEVDGGSVVAAVVAARHIADVAKDAASFVAGMPDSVWRKAAEPLTEALVRAGNLASLVESDGVDAGDAGGYSGAVGYASAVGCLCDVLKAAGDPLGDDHIWAEAVSAAEAIECMGDAAVFADDGPPPVVRVDKPAVRAATAAVLRALSTPELLSFNRRLHQLWGAHVADVAEPDEDLSAALVRAKVLMLAEFARRGIESEVDDGLSERAEARKADVHKTIWGSPAGKKRLAKRLVAMLPEHKTYVEPFAGSAAVFFEKDPVATEVLNDQDADIARAFRIIGRLSENDLDALEKKNWVGDRGRFERVVSSKPSGDVDWIYKFLYSTLFSYFRTRSTFNAGYQGNRATTVARLRKHSPRLKGVKVFSEDYEKVCKRFDSKDALHFLDPPYTGHDVNVGENRFDEHRFMKMVSSLKGKVLITYGVRGDLPGLMKKAGLRIKRIKSKRTAEGMRGVGGPKTLTQIIAANFDIVSKDDDPDGWGLEDFDPDAPPEDVVDQEKFAPVEPSGEKAGDGDAIELGEVLDKFEEDIVVRRDAVVLVGGLPNHGKTPNDIDLLLRGPFSDEVAKVIKFRLGRALGDRLAKRTQFLPDDLGGPFTHHVPLYDLHLVARRDRSVIEMADLEAVQKQADPLLTLPPTPGPKPAVLQLHARGKGVHGDLRMKANGHLVGWTLFIAKPGGIGEDIETVADAKRPFSGYDVEDGNEAFKPIKPGVQALPKQKIPVEWLNVERVFEPGKPGVSTDEKYGVMAIVDRPKVEFLAQKPSFHEYAFTQGGVLNGILMFRLLPNEWRGESPDPRSGRASTIWRAIIGQDLLPHVVTRRAVNTKWMPPVGKSALPLSLMRQTPREFRYWLRRGDEARKIRDALVAERFFTEKNIRIVDGEFRRVERKFFLPAKVEKAEATDAIVVDAADAERIVGGEQSQIVKSRRFDIAGHRYLLADGDHVWGEVEFSAAEQVETEKFAYEIVDLELYESPKAYEPPPEAGTFVRDVRFKVDKDARKFAVSWQFWKREAETQRPEPSRQVWHFMLARSDGGTDRWELTADPTAPGERFSGRYFKHSDQKIMAHDGPVKPGEKIGGIDMNPTKATPSQIRRLDGGDVQVDDERPGFKRLRFSGRFVKGPYVLVAEQDPKGIWLLSRGAKPPRAVAEADWTPDKGLDPSTDRKALKPFARVVPMKPRDTAFTQIPEAIKRVGTAGNLEVGVALEPKWNGFVLVAQGDGKGQVRVTTDDGHDITKNLPKLAMELKGIKEPFIVVGEGMEFIGDDPQPRRDLARFRGSKPVDDDGFRLMVFHLLFGGGQAMVDLPYETQRRRLQQFIGKWKLERVRMTPNRIAHNERQLAPGYALGFAPARLRRRDDEDARVDILARRSDVVVVEDQNPAQHSGHRPSARGRGGFAGGLGLPLWHRSDPRRRRRQVQGDLRGRWQALRRDWPDVQHPRGREARRCAGDPSCGTARRQTHRG